MIIQNYKHATCLRP